MWRPQRKDVLFVLGVIGIALEQTRLFGEPSETLLLLFAAMIGLPLVLRADESRHEEATPSDPDTPKSPPSSDGATP